MIPEGGRLRRLWVLLCAVVLLGGPAVAQEEGTQEDGAGEESEGSGEAEDAEEGPASEDPPPLDDSLSRYRTPFGVLAERAIGTTSTPVEFSWRRSRVHLAATGDHLYELNNFNSLRAGGMARLPSQGLIYELGLSYVFVWDSLSSERLALTPYRQPGRPERLEIDFNVGLPLAEGVVTVAPKWFPSVQMVFNGYAGFRYLLYPHGFKEMKIGAIAGALLSPTMTQAELENLDKWRNDAMQLDRARYGILLGVGNDLYFKQGLFVSPRAMFAVPLLAPATETELLFYADLVLAVGVAL